MALVAVVLSISLFWGAPFIPIDWAPFPIRGETGEDESEAPITCMTAGRPSATIMTMITWLYFDWGCRRPGWWSLWAWWDPENRDSEVQSTSRMYLADGEDELLEKGEKQATTAVANKPHGIRNRSVETLTVDLDSGPASEVRSICTPTPSWIGNLVEEEARRGEGGPHREMEEGGRDEVSSDAWESVVSTRSCCRPALWARNGPLIRLGDGLILVIGARTDDTRAKGRGKDRSVDFLPDRFCFFSLFFLFFFCTAVIGGLMVRRVNDWDGSFLRPRSSNLVVHGDGGGGDQENIDY